MKAKSKIYKIQNNEDWSNLNHGEESVWISNDSYFGFRAMEKEVKEIIYDPCSVTSLVRIGKESRKFPITKHNLLLTTETLGFDSSKSEEAFLKDSTKVIEELLELNDEIKLDFTIESETLNKDFIYEVLKKIYM